MRTQFSSFPSFLFLLSSYVANSDNHGFGNLPSDHIVYGPSRVHGPALGRPKRQTEPPGSHSPEGSCRNGPEMRSCWSNGYNIATDFDQKWPNTGITRSYDWTVTNTTCNPSGESERYCSLINGQYPGPILEADWGDMVSVTIHNNLEYNGTGIHWHGVRQLNSNAMDGTNGITECPIPPGQSKTYTFQATQFGTSWYHSHHSSQYGDGVLGPIVFNGPATANYDIDLGPLLVTDWYDTGSFAEDAIQQEELDILKVGPGPDALLINGTNGVNNGNYLTIALAPEKSHRLRLVNTAVRDPIRVSIDNHQLQIITSDFVPILPIWADSVVLGIGQRYDLIVKANQSVGNYWLRAEAEEICTTLPSQVPARAIVRYDGAPDSEPTTTSTVTSSGCTAPGILAPFVPNDVGNAEDFKQQARDLDVDVIVPGATTNQQNIVVWGIDSGAIDVQWNDPILQYVKTKNTSYPATENLIELTNSDVWVYWIIQDASNVTQPWHPMHLHGHDFYVLGSDTGQFSLNADPERLTYNNPTRRDTANLPGNGWLAIAFPTDNPGAWLFHCHISWHISEGLGLQFLETKESIHVPDSLTSQCADWQAYYETAMFKQEESGL